jgi:hypothetical protein
MKIRTALAATALAGLAALLASPAFADNSQQSKMTTCNKLAGDMKGDDRKAFMKSCLSSATPMTQQQKMGWCNQQAGDKKGDDRKAFMKTCLSNKS